MSVIATIADGVLALIQDGVAGYAFDVSFSASREYVPVDDLRDISEVLVSVIPLTHEPALLTRGNSQHVVDIAVVIRQKVANELNATLDPLLALGEDIADWLNGRYTETTPVGKFQSIAHAPIFDPESLRAKKVFLSMVTAKYLAVT